MDLLLLSSPNMYEMFEFYVLYKYYLSLYHNNSPEYSILSFVPFLKSKDQAAIYALFFCLSRATLLEIPEDQGAQEETEVTGLL